MAVGTEGFPIDTYPPADRNPARLLALHAEDSFVPLGSMENWVVIVGTLVLGVVGVIAFLSMSPGDTKTRRSKSGLKPREDLYTQ